MNIIESQVSQVQRDGDNYTIPPITVCKRYTHLALTVLYDLLNTGPGASSYATIDNLSLKMAIPDRYRSRGAVEDFIKSSGRVIVDEWLGPVTHRSHVEPV